MSPYENECHCKHILIMYKTYQFALCFKGKTSETAFVTDDTLKQPKNLVFLHSRKQGFAAQLMKMSEVFYLSKCSNSFQCGHNKNIDNSTWFILKTVLHKSPINTFLTNWLYSTYLYWKYGQGCTTRQQVTTSINPNV